MRVPVSDPPEDAESIRELFHEVRWRLGVCVGSYLFAFVLVLVPIPYLTEVSITQVVIMHLVPPVANHLMSSYIPPGDGFRFYFAIASLTALALDQPVIICHVLALFAPPPFAWGARRRAVTAMAITAAFAVGAAIAYIVLLQAMEAYLIRLQEQQPNLPIRWTLLEYGLFKLHVVFQTGLAFQVPVWLVILRWLEVVRMERLAKLRPYALLIAVIVAALATPTPDILTMTVVALPLYLLYEAGLLVARLVPTPD